MSPFAKYLLVILLAGIIYPGLGQDTILIEKVNSDLVHTLILPQRMEFNYSGKIKKHQVAAFSEGSFISEKGPLIDMDYTSVRASRFKPVGLKLVGSVVAAGGLLGIIGGFGLALDDSFLGGPETGLPVLAVGAALFYAGAKIAGSRKTYKKEKWQIRLTPTEYVKQPLDPYEFRVGSQ